jgi:bifunctional UDP-N-acetylglucosamine pyrophosphorylase / glucosamine-1-phosphate N-acetyltransferase
VAARTGRPLAAVILAAGEGKRFRSSKAKVLHSLLGRPLVAHVLDAVAPLRAAKTLVVVGRDAEGVQAALDGRGVGFVTQERLLGTADAVRTADEALGRFAGDVLVTAGDTPLLTTETMRNLVKHHRARKAAATVLSAHLADPTGYGRLVRAADGSLERIVEHRDATPAERAIGEINVGVWVFDRAALRTALTKIDARNAQGELYLTDVVEILRADGRTIAAYATANPEEGEGVNDRAQLAAVAATMRARIARRHAEAGVTILDPATTYIEPGVKIGADTVIAPNTTLRGATAIGAGVEIGPSVDAVDSTVADGARVRFAVLDQAVVGKGAQVGPFAYLRPGAVLKANAKVGTYVEVKGSTIGEGSKVPHLSYIGDATVGRDVNIGAATITCNYDGETRTKAKTVIGDEARIGSDTMLVAPVKLGKRAVTGAGSVVTKDVPAGTVVYGNPARPRRTRKPTAGA